MLAASHTAILCRDVLQAGPPFVAPSQKGQGRDWGEPCELRSSLLAAFSAVWVSLVFMIGKYSFPDRSLDVYKNDYTARMDFGSLLVEQHFSDAYLKNLSKLTGPWSCKVKRIVFRQHVAPVCFCISSNTSHAAGFAFGSYGWMFMQSYRRISSPGIEPSSLRCRGRNATSVAKLGHHEFKLSYLSPSWTFSEHKL